MSPPELPRSQLDGGKPEWVSVFIELPLYLVGAWEVFWLVLLLAGDSPQGQIWSVPGRIASAATRSLEGHATAGGWLGILIGVFHPVALMPVVLVVVGLVLLALVVVLVVDHGLPTRGSRRHRSQGPSSGGSRPKEAASAQRDTSLEEFLEKQSRGEKD